MDHKFYDVKTKQSVKAAITEVKKYGEGTRTRYAVRGHWAPPSPRRWSSR